MGQGGSGGSSGHSNSAPWLAQQPYLKEIYSAAQSLYPTAMPYYPDATVAAEDPARRAAYQATVARATGGNPLLDNAIAASTRDVSGANLQGSPYLDAMFNRASEAVRRAYGNTVLPGLESTFSGSGRFGSPGYEASVRENANRPLAESLENLATDIYGGNYEQERNRQEAAIAGAPALSAGGYSDIAQLFGAGQTEQDYAQQVLNSLIERYQYGQQEPWQRLGLYSNTIGAPVITSNSQQRSWGQGIGMALLSAI